ncbi:unnamed protein product [Linum tenue]|uniref:Cupin type-1 domain-containing protein n=1 Tax=Linum tenue TaxID=586396 RepID=A0AAV0QMY8_9ROSI|nr:unnamed protein product [Linum tenue]
MTSVASFFFGLVVALSCLSLQLALASDPGHLQDFCVADATRVITVLLNGVACKNPSTVTANDFYFRGLHVAGNTSNAQGSRVTPVFAAQLPGLNTLGISMVRIDYAAGGQNPPHTHPRSLEVGFVTSNPNNRHFTKTLYKGDVFVFPSNTIHYQRNTNWKAPAVAIAALSSQNPGATTIANAVFGSQPGISADILAKSFSLDVATVNFMQSKF